MVLALQSTLDSIANIVVATSFFVGLSGGIFYVIRRRVNGQSVLPGNTNDEMVHILRDIRDEIKNGNSKIHEAIENGSRTNSEEHERMLNTLAPRQPGGKDV